MAIQQGIMPFTGKMGELVGFYRKNKLYTKKAPGSYKVTEESKKSGQEFGRGSSASALVRQAFEPLILSRFKTDLHNRLAEQFRKVIRSGPLSHKGNRRVIDGNIGLMKGFEFSQYARFDKLVWFSPKVSISENSVSVTIPALSWKDGLRGPEKATRAVFGLICGFFDFENGAGERLLSGDLIIEKHQPFSGAALHVPVSRQKEQVVLVMMTVFFSDAAGERISRIDNRLFQAGIILEAAHIRNGKLVNFIPEEMPEMPERPVIQPDVSWNLVKAGEGNGV